MKDFPGDPVLKALSSDSRGAGSIHGQRDPTCFVAKKPKRKIEAIL